MIAVTAVVVLTRALVAFPLEVQGGSMEPTLRSGDVVLVLKGAVDPRAVQRGDLVVFDDPQGGLAVKRVVGLPGDEVAILDGVLFVDGVAPAEPYVDQGSVDAVYFGPVEVPSSSVFLMGDDRAGSIDSRDYGPVDLDRLTGRVELRVWPPSGVG